MTAPKSTRGGKRARAGRPKMIGGSLKVAACYSLPRSRVEWLRAQTIPASWLIAAALDEVHGFVKTQGKS